ncbi:hypothetical protein UFOVP1313_47 [uncultured Caudovirales phage]|uniref:Uncharacterized protein n=1 Tax=uncultured Caudovirales phage TaxID=2100421 RepID=A0A6J5S0B1_9CAUD|nr:hypothetical protein UFOVP1313_47 [uncultured Caudovirales phage]
MTTDEDWVDFDEWQAENAMTSNERNQVDQKTDQLKITMARHAAQYGTGGAAYRQMERELAGETVERKFKIGKSNALCAELDSIASVELENVLAAWPEFDEKQARHLVGYLQDGMGSYGNLTAGHLEGAGCENTGQIRSQAKRVIERLAKQGIVVDGKDYESTSNRKTGQSEEPKPELTPEQESNVRVSNRISNALNNPDGFAAIWG